MCENNGVFVSSAKHKTTGLGLSMTAIGGKELSEGKKIDTLASCWLMCKESYKKLIGGKSDKEILAWANSVAAGKNLDGKGEI